MYAMAFRFPVYFNSRPSARGDDCRRDRIHRAGYFNSRPSARGDPSDKGDGEEYLVFQFTPLREGRREQERAKVLMDAFQFTPLREGRLGIREGRDAPKDFNSRPSARGDRCSFSR